jgi:hypothetical protein
MVVKVFEKVILFPADHADLRRIDPPGNSALFSGQPNHQEGKYQMATGQLSLAGNQSGEIIKVMVIGHDFIGYKKS